MLLKSIKADCTVILQLYRLHIGQPGYRKAVIIIFHFYMICFQVIRRHAALDPDRIAITQIRILGQSNICPGLGQKAFQLVFLRRLQLLFLRDRGLQAFHIQFRLRGS